MSKARPAPSPEAPRDLDESEFTELLRQIRVAVPAVEAAIFVDNEGECIDYASSIDPFDAKVTGAQMLDLERQLERTSDAVRAGAHFSLEIGFAAYEIWCRRLSDDYLLVLRVVGSFERSHLRSVSARVGQAFRAAVNIETPAWEPVAPPVDVRTRPSIGWDYAPASFREHGERVAVEDVLGRWVESDVVEDAVCFRIRTIEGRELTLVHDPDSDAWAIRNR